MRHFLDTYALVEIIKENKNYEKYLDEDVCTTIFNLYELYYNLLKEEGKEVAERYFSRFHEILFNFRKEHIFLASEIKLENRKKRISYTDSLGYAISISESMVFVTGDKEFKGMKGVDFVK